MKKTTALSFTLSLPPSINAMYKTRRGQFGMYKSAEAKQWISDSLIQMRLQGVPRKRAKGKWDVLVNFYFKHERDCDGGIKPLLDILQEYGLIENDRDIYSITAIKYFDKKNPHCFVEVRNNGS